MDGRPAIVAAFYKPFKGGDSLCVEKMLQIGSVFYVVAFYDYSRLNTLDPENAFPAMTAFLGSFHLIVPPR